MRAPDGRDSARFLGFGLSYGSFPFPVLFSPAAGNAGCELQQHLIQAKFLKIAQFSRIFDDSDT